MSILRIEEVSDRDAARVGGKAVALAALSRAGLSIPISLCLTVDAYRRFVDAADLEAFVILELGRKPLEDMRWEELWDAALRIRNRFLRASMADADRRELEDAVREVFGVSTLVVRSSAPGEDSSQVSFAGLHDSYVGGTVSDVADHVQRVWASLWSDRALLYRRELGLEVKTSSMAVVIQDLIEGDASGVAFSVDPTNPERSVVEAVHGLNQGLVDGTVAPDRWFLDRNRKAVISHHPPPQREQMRLDGVQTSLSEAAPDRPPLDEDGLARVIDAMGRVEHLFGSPQDMEWTIHNQRLTVLQARPVTTLVAGDDQRAWYLSLTRSVDNLQELRRRIESEFLPAMDQDAERLANRDLGLLDDQELAEEIDRRKAMHDHWVDIYWREFIPFAHGVRLFGQFYNELVRPVDPFEFMDLLTSTPMLSVQRNRVLEALADHVRDNPALVAGDSGDAEFETDVRSFIERFGNTAFGDERPFADRKRVLKIIAQLAGRPPVRTVEPISRESFLARIDQRSRETASDLLELARASYRLRDDDNIHLAAIKAEVLRAAGEGRSRLGSNADALDIDRIIHSLRNPNTVVEPSPRASEPQAEPGFELRPRQLVGQPAGPGVALGPARVLAKPDDLFDFVDGEVLVCDAVEPNMTFVVPLAAAVVERRGGMLIHGAIIAREYGLPCVTGVQHVTKLVRTGDRLTVDGYLGIVTVGTHERDTEIS